MNASDVTDITGSDNINIGYETAFALQSGLDNLIIGNRSGYNLTTGNNNVKIGNLSGFTNNTGSNNILIGKEAGFSGNPISNNIYIGFRSGYYSNEYPNVGIGTYSLFNSTSGYGNTAIGYQSGYSNTTGTYNTFIGYNSGYNILQKINSINTLSLGTDSYTDKNDQVSIGNSSILENVFRGGQLLVQNMTSSAPSYSFINSPSTGMFYGSSYLQLVSLGNTYLYLGSSQVESNYKIIAPSIKITDFSGIGIRQVTALSDGTLSTTTISSGATNLSTTQATSTVTVNSDTGTDAIIPAATQSLAGVLNTIDKTKIDNIWVTTPQSLSGTTVTMTWTSGINASITLSGNTTFTIEGMPDGGESQIEVTNGSSSYTFNLNGSTGYTTEVIMGNNATINTTISSHTTVVIWRRGSTLYYGFVYNN